MAWFALAIEHIVKAVLQKGVADGPERIHNEVGGVEARHAQGINEARLLATKPLSPREQQEKAPSTESTGLKHASVA